MADPLPGREAARLGLGCTGTHWLATGGSGSVPQDLGTLPGGWLVLRRRIAPRDRSDVAEPSPRSAGGTAGQDPIACLEANYEGLNRNRFGARPSHCQEARPGPPGGSAPGCASVSGRTLAARRFAARMGTEGSVVSGTHPVGERSEAGKVASRKLIPAPNGGLQVQRAPRRRPRSPIPPSRLGDLASHFRLPLRHSIEAGLPCGDRRLPEAREGGLSRHRTLFPTKVGKRLQGLQGHRPRSEDGRHPTSLARVRDRGPGMASLGVQSKGRIREAVRSLRTGPGAA